MEINNESLNMSLLTSRLDSLKISMFNDCEWVLETNEIPA